MAADPRSAIGYENPSSSPVIAAKAAASKPLDAADTDDQDQRSSQGYGENGPPIASTDQDDRREQAGGSEEEDDVAAAESEEDWLMSDDEVAQKPPTNSGEPDELDGVVYSGMDMASRDSAKIQRTFYDTGYREGITAGKLSSLQVGFDQGFNASTAIGRAKGQLRGELQALDAYIGTAQGNTGAAKGTSGRYGRAKAVSSRSRSRDADLTQATVADDDKDDLQAQLRQLLREVEALDAEALLPPDWEAKKHEAEHAGLDTTSSDYVEETEAQRQRREAILVDVRARFETLKTRALTVDSV